MWINTPVEHKLLCMTFNVTKLLHIVVTYSVTLSLIVDIVSVKREINTNRGKAKTHGLDLNNEMAQKTVV